MSAVSDAADDMVRIGALSQQDATRICEEASQRFQIGSDEWEASL